MTEEEDEDAEMHDEDDFVCVPLSNIDKNTMTFKNPYHRAKLSKIGLNS